MKIISHQGTRIFAPENSVLGYEIAGQMGYWGLNFAQVRASKEGTLFVMHDPTVDRTTNGTGEIKDLSDAEIKSLVLDVQEDYAEFDINSLTDEQKRVASLEEGLEVCKKYNMVPMIRMGLKPQGNEKAFENLYSLVEKFDIEKTFILSGPVETMQFLDAKYPNTIKVVFSKTANADEMISLFDSYSWLKKSNIYAMIKPCFLSASDIKKIHDAGYGAYAANPNDWRKPEEAKAELVRLEKDGCEFVNTERFASL